MKRNDPQVTQMDADEKKGKKKKARGRSPGVRNGGTLVGP
jgi:hypothetical protein